MRLQRDIATNLAERQELRHELHAEE
jgi:hypothetical protein